MPRTPGATNKTAREHKQDMEIARLKAVVADKKTEIKQLKNK
jgi:hypothetical protein